jgi:Leucine-rich repeat (LRR) protein
MPALQSDLLVAGLSNVNKSPECLAHVYLNFALPDSELSDITLLEGYRHLQNVNLRGNALTEVKTLGKLLHLTKLDVSKNELKEFLDFHPPRALREVDYSENAIESLGNIERHPYLRKVVRAHPYTRCSDLTTCLLSTLLLFISCVSQILAGNSLLTLRNIATCAFLNYLDVSNNVIADLTHVKNHSLTVETYTIMHLI